MRKFNLIFISLIGLATLALGLIWGQVQSLAVAPVSFGNIALMVFYSLLLIAALFCLVSILVRLAPASEPGEHQEVER